MTITEEGLAIVQAEAERLWQRKMFGRHVVESVRWRETVIAGNAERAMRARSLSDTHYAPIEALMHAEIRLEEARIAHESPELSVKVKEKADG